MSIFLFLFRVKLAQSSDGKCHALKISKLEIGNENTDCSNNQELFYAEADALQDLKHKNIIKYHGHSECSSAVRKDGTSTQVQYIALEYLGQGEIFDYVAQTGRFSEEEARYYFKQLIEAVEYIHENGYSHRDIKPENILLDSKFNLRLADFGFATRARRSSARKGTYGYMAPEVYAQKEYDCRLHDLYGAAVVLFVLATQHPPFTKADPQDKYFKKIYEEKWSQFWEVHSDSQLSESFIDLMTKMLAYKPEDRLSIAQIKQHEWFKGPNLSEDEIFARFTKRS